MIVVSESFENAKGKMVVNVKEVCPRCGGGETETAQRGMMWQ